MNIYLRALYNFRSLLGNIRFYSIFLFGLLTGTILVAEPVFFSRVIFHIEQYISNGSFNTNELIFDSILWGGYIIISIIVFFLYRYYFTDKNILGYYVYNLEKSIKKSLQAKYSVLLEKKPGEIIKNIEKGRESFINFFFFFFLEFYRNISGFIAILIFMLVIDVRMTFITLSGLPIIIFVGYFFNKKTTKLQKDLNDEEDIIFGDVSDGISNFGLVKTLGLENLFLRKFIKKENRLLDHQYKISYRWAIAYNYISGLIAIMRLIVLLIGFYFITKNTLTFTELFLFFQYIGWIYYPIGFIFGQFRQVQRWGASMEAYYKNFEENIEIENTSKGGVLKNIQGNIRFNDVNFGYTDDKQILNNISFDIQPGQKIALVGNTGAGKSTIVSLLLRFWDVDKGEILIEGKNINTIKKSSLRNHIGVVSQDNSLFNLSIEENLKFANPKATRKQIDKALKLAEAEFVFDLKDGVKTVIGERGLKLSGGEKQRISIARLFLKNPEILILDEATSALDNITERKIEKALKKLMKGKTSIIIAHRLSTIMHADKILMLENGKIVETGSYDELIEKKGKFFELVNPDKLILG